MIIEILEIKQKVTKLFCKYGLEQEKSEKITEILLNSHLKGYPSHGLARVPGYLKDINSEIINIHANLEIIKDLPSTLAINANRGLGPLQLIQATNLAIEKAKQTGICAMSVKNSNDIARLGSYVEHAANCGLVSLLFVNDGGANPAVCPTGTTTAFFSTNPIAAGIPSNKGWPIIIDISTATVAIGRLRQALNFNQLIPEGWLITKDGQQTTDPSTFFKENKLSAILPLGGILRGHKGYALSLLVDILAGGLSGAGMSTGSPNHPEANGIFMLLINPNNFVDLDEFEKEVGELINRLKELPGNVRIPGERPQKIISDNDVVEIDPITWDKIQDY